MGTEHSRAQMNFAAREQAAGDAVLVPEVVQDPPKVLRVPIDEHPPTQRRLALARDALAGQLLGDRGARHELGSAHVENHLCWL